MSKYDLENPWLTYVQIPLGLKKKENRSWVLKLTKKLCKCQTKKNGQLLTRHFRENKQFCFHPVFRFSSAHFYFFLVLETRSNANQGSENSGFRSLLTCFPLSARAVECWYPLNLSPSTSALTALCSTSYHLCARYFQVCISKLFYLPTYFQMLLLCIYRLTL